MLSKLRGNCVFVLTVKAVEDKNRRSGNPCHEIGGCTRFDLSTETNRDLFHLDDVFKEKSATHQQ